MSSLAQDRTAVIVDQHTLWLDSVARVVEGAGVRVVLRTCSPAEALDRLDELQPDLLITEIRMPEHEVDGLAFIREARTQSPQLRTMVLSEYDDPDHIGAAFDAGANCYVLKSALAEDVAAGVRQAFCHSIYLPGVPAQSAEVAAPSADAARLTRREQEILELVAQGHSNAQVARILWVTEQTVKFHLSNVYRKLEVANRTEASRWAQVQGLLGVPRTALPAAS